MAGVDRFLFSFALFYSILFYPVSLTVGGVYNFGKRKKGREGGRVSFRGPKFLVRSVPAGFAIDSSARLELSITSPHWHHGSCLRGGFFVCKSSVGTGILSSSLFVVVRAGHLVGTWLALKLADTCFRPTPGELRLIALRLSGLGLQVQLSLSLANRVCHGLCDGLTTWRDQYSQYSAIAVLLE